MPSRRATPSATPSPRPARGSAKGPTREALLAALAERERELAEALARQTATSEILRVISQSPTDAKPVFQRIVVTAARLLRCDMAFVLLREGDAYVHTAGATPEGPMADLAPERIPIDPSANFPSRAFLAKTMLHLPDWSLIDLPEHERHIHEMFGVNSVLYLPLLRGEECIGVLVFGGRRANIFGPSEIAQAESFRDQALIAMENARLFRETREALEQQKASAEVLGAISKSVADTSPVFETILDACQRLFGSEEIGIYTIGDDEMVRAAAWRGPRAEEARQDVTPLAESVTGRVIRERRTHHIPDLGAVPNLSPMLRDRVNRHGGASLLYAPMLWEDSGLGSIAVVRWPPRPFSDREQALLQSFADQAVIAIQNARIFEEVQAKTRDLTEALQQQTATAEVLKVISRSAFDLTLATTTILEAAAKLCRAPLATLHLRDGEVCRLVTQFGLPEAFERQAREAPIPIRYPLHSRRSARAGEFAHFSDAWTDPDYLYKATARLGGYRAIVVIPLMREGELVGIFSLGRPEPEPFTESQIKLTQTFADQAAIAIENARLFNEVKARTDELSEALEHQKASGEVLRAIAQSVADATPVFENILDASQRLFGTEEVCIFMVGEDGMVRPAAARGLGFSAARNDVMPLEGSRTGRVIRERRVHHIPDGLAEPGTPPALLERMRRSGNVSIAFAPMLWEDSGLGSIAILRSPPRPFSERELELLRGFADQAVIAIQNARMFNEVQAKTRDLEEALQQQTATADVLKVISRSAFDLDAVLNSLTRSAVELCNSTYGVISLYRDGVLKFMAQTGCTPEFAELLRSNPAQLDRKSVTGRTGLLRTVVLVPDVTQDEEYDYHGGEIIGNYRSCMGVPLLRNGELEGVFTLMRAEPGTFTQRQIELVQTFADQAVIAIENVRLFNEVQARTRDLTGGAATSDRDLRGAEGHQPLGLRSASGVRHTHFVCSRTLRR